jgi:nickel-type superoxide dismutase maturation protease
VRTERYHSLRYPIFALITGGAAIWVALRRPFRMAVEGESMVPTLRPGDFLIGVRSGPIRKGALVVVEHPKRPGYEMVKRLAGAPGDEIEGVRLGPDQFWMVGDNAAASADSRTLGPFDRRAIRGVVRFRYWPPSRFGPLGPSSSTRHRRWPSALTTSSLDPSRVRSRYRR